MIDHTVFGLTIGGLTFPTGTIRWRDELGMHHTLSRREEGTSWRYTVGTGFTGTYGSVYEMTTEEAQALLRTSTSVAETFTHTPIHVCPIHDVAREPKLAEDSLNRPTSRQTVAEEAMASVEGARMEDYGTPEDNFDRWSQICSAMGYELSRKDLAKILIAMKLARLAHSLKRDSMVDLIGYTLLLERFSDV